MSRQLIVAPSARADLAEIRDYYEQTAGKQIAGRVLTALYDATSRLADGKAIGHARHDLADDPIRFYLVFRYFIVYRIDASKLIVFRVLHTARDVQSILG